MLARLTGSWAPIASDIKKPGVTELAYPKLPTRAMMQLRRLWAATRADLARVTAPVLVFHSVEDHVVEPVNTPGAARRRLQHRRHRGRAARTATTWRPSTTTPRRSSPARSTGSGRTPAAPTPADARGAGDATARRGRRDNGLDAALWSPLRDVDPRVGEHLLDVLHAVGHRRLPGAVGRRRAVHAHGVACPARRSDRLFVDRARRRRGPHGRRRARAGRDERPTRPADAGAGPSGPPSAGTWTRTPSGRGSSPPSRPRTAGHVDRRTPRRRPRRPPAPHELPILDRPDEHYEPPPPPPLPVPAPASLYAVLLVIVGVLLVGAPGVLRLSADVGLVLGVAAIAGGVAMLVSRMRDRSDDDGDDGAVV